MSVTRSSADTPLDLVRFSSFAGVSHAISSRHGGVSSHPYATLNLGLSTGDQVENVLENRRRFVAALDLNAEQVAMARLTHGTDVAVFHSGRGNRVQSFAADAFLSNLPGLHVLLTFADCVPLLFADRIRGVVGAAHAGWRGTASGIAAAVVDAMIEKFGSNPEDIIVGIGPSIGPCCYTVGRDVLIAFHRNDLSPVIRENGSITFLDLQASNRRQLVERGVRPNHIEDYAECTCCNTGRFFSYRGEDGRTGRFALCIGIP